MQQKEITMYWMICFNKQEFVHTRNIQNDITKLRFFGSKKTTRVVSNALARTSVLGRPRTMVVERLLSIWEGLCLKAATVSSKECKTKEITEELGAPQKKNYDLVTENTRN